MEMSKEKIGIMFDKIAFRYDFLNHLMSFGIDKIWRRKAIREIPDCGCCPAIIDIATGTADLAIAALSLNPLRIDGIDISNNMLEIGRQKISTLNKSSIINLYGGASEAIPFADNSYDIAMSAFGARNFNDLGKGLSEMFRVLKVGGYTMILEFSKPRKFPFRQIYLFYFLRVLPFIGAIISKDKAAYKYLPESVMGFPDNNDFISVLKKAGFEDVRQKRLTFGIASVYIGKKVSRH